MKSKATTVEQYIKELPAGRKEVIEKLRQVILENMPIGLEEEMSYGMIGYLVPHKLYPKGYHANPKLPLPFVNLASQKNYISLYHMGLYEDAELLQWFQDEYPKHSMQKLNMGKCCVRFKKLEAIPYELIGELMSKLSLEEYITNYDSILEKTKKP